jgi:hydroxycarboxylate dehydrogenase B
LAEVPQVSTQAKPHVFGAPALRTAVAELVRGMGSSEAEAQTVALNLVDANLTGHDSHGIGMLPRYVNAYLEGDLQPNAQLSVELDGGALLRLGGGGGFGQVIGRDAMALAIERAQRHGSAIVALGNTHHLGRIGAWAEQAAASGLVSLHLVNVIARPIVAPFGGSDARFGTNPFCVGIPLAGHAPVILDFATSVVAQGKARVAHNKGEQIAPGCLIDDQGRPSTDPRFGVIPPFGALLAFGEHKGYGLALVCELLGGALAAGATLHGPDTGRQRVMNGMFSVLIDPSALGHRQAFEQEALAFIEWVRASPPREGFGEVTIAGDVERRSRAQRSARGIPVDASTWQDILAAAGKLGLDPSRIDAVARGVQPA